AQPRPPQQVEPQTELPKPELLNTHLQNSFISIGGNLSFASDAQLSNSQVAYVNSLNGLGVGQHALIATGGIEDSYPFLKEILEEEGFSVEYAANTTNMLEMATSMDLQLVMIEFNETEGANQYAVNALRNLPQSSKFFIIVLEAAIQGVDSYNSMPNVMQIIIPNSDEELVDMIRESLAEILLTGNSFLAEGN
ncbi:hypothetical protein IJT10_00005, partial [bacterium]|nr:hypothetical protein [bacterium]